MKKNRRGLRLTAVDVRFSILMASLLSLMAVSVKFPQFNHSFSSVVVTFTEPFIQASRQPSLWVDSITDAVDEHLFVVEKNQNLRAQQQRLFMMEHEVSVLARENAKLRDMLGMVTTIPGAPLTAYILADGASAFTHSTLVNVGEKEGIMKGQEVLSDRGLVGRVVDVYDSTSRLLLLTDYTSRVPVKFVKADVQGIVKGTNGSHLELLFVEADKMIEVGDKVITSGIGGVFSVGLPVGEVVSVTDEVVRIKPYVDFDSLELVTIQRKTVEGIIDGSRTN